MEQDSACVPFHREDLLSNTTILLANHHVVEGAGRIHITIQGRWEFKAKSIDADPQSDLAALEIKATLPEL